MSILDRIKKSWNVFKAKDEEAPTRGGFFNAGPSYSHRPDKKRYFGSSSREITNSIYTRIGVDFADVDMKHIREDKNNRYLKDVDSGLNRCLTLSANTDQSGRAFRQDIAMTMLEEGVVAIVPIDTDVDPKKETTFEIHTMRVGTVTAWYPDKVTVRVFRQNTGQFEELTMPKSVVGIVENPFYSIMNEANSTLKRLSRKLALMDVVDEYVGSGKLDVIIQLPYVIKSDSKRDQAEQRRKDLETQLRSSDYGVAYTDGTERVIQLNRPMENNLLKNVQHLTAMLYSQLGLTEEIMNGTADESFMLNYQSRIIKPMLRSVTEELKRKYITQTGITQGQSIEFFIDPFLLVPPSQLPEMADKFTRNAILSSNEFRQIIGFRPVKDPKADELSNKNISAAKGADGEAVAAPVVTDDE